MEYVVLAAICAGSFGLGRLFGWWVLPLPIALGLVVGSGDNLEGGINEWLGLVFGVASFVGALAGAISKTRRAH